MISCNVIENKRNVEWSNSNEKKNQFKLIINEIFMKFIVQLSFEIIEFSSTKLYSPREKNFPLHFMHKSIDAFQFIIK